MTEVAPLHDQLNATTASVLLIAKTKKIPMNIIFVGPPHVGKKHLMNFASKYLGASNVTDLVSNETSEYLVGLKTRRNECNIFSGQDQCARELRLGLDQKTCMFHKQHLMSLDRVRFEQEEEVRKRLEELCMNPEEKAKRVTATARPKSPAMPPSVRPCPNIKLYSGSTITDLFGRANALWSHKLISRDEYTLFKDTVKRVSWQLENLACPSHQTLYVYLEPEPHLYTLKVYSYFQNIMAMRFNKEVRGDENLFNEYGKRYLALCMEINSYLGRLFVKEDMVSRFFTVTIRFENDLCGSDLICKLICDVIMKHAQGLIQSGAWSASTRSPLSNNSALFKAELNKEIYSSLDRLYVMPKIRFKEDEPSSKPRNGKPVPMDAVRTGSMIVSREMPVMYSNTPPPSAKPISMDLSKLRKGQDIGDEASEFLHEEDEPDGHDQKTVVTSVIADHNNSAAKKRTENFVEVPL